MAKLLLISDGQQRLIACEGFSGGLTDVECFLNSKFYKTFLSGKKTLGAFKCRFSKNHWVNATILMDIGFSPNLSHVNVNCVKGWEQVQRDGCAAGRLLVAEFARQHAALGRIRLASERIHANMPRQFRVLLSGVLRFKDAEPQVAAVVKLYSARQQHLLISGYQCSYSVCPCKISYPDNTTKYRASSIRCLGSSIIGGGEEAPNQPAVVDNNHNGGGGPSTTTSRATTSCK